MDVVEPVLLMFLERPASGASALTADCLPPGALPHKAEVNGMREQREDDGR